MKSFVCAVTVAPLSLKSIEPEPTCDFAGHLSLVSWLCEHFWGTAAGAAQTPGGSVIAKLLTECAGSLELKAILFVMLGFEPAAVVEGWLVKLVTTPVSFAARAEIGPPPH